jgi:hypothetical protein
MAYNLDEKKNMKFHDIIATNEVVPKREFEGQSPAKILLRLSLNKVGWVFEAIDFDEVLLDRASRNEAKEQ